MSMKKKILQAQAVYIYIQLYCSRLELVKLALNPLLLLPLSASLRRKEKLRE